MSVIEGLRESFRLPDLRRRILITILLLIIYRFAANVPVPGVDRTALAEMLNQNNGVGTLANVLDLLSGGAVSNFSVLAMGVYPYITASIIIQILTPVIPALEEITKEGQAAGTKSIAIPCIWQFRLRCSRRSHRSTCSVTTDR